MCNVILNSFLNNRKLSTERRKYSQEMISHVLDSWRHDDNQIFINNAKCHAALFCYAFFMLLTKFLYVSNDKNYVILELSGRYTRLSGCLNIDIRIGRCMPASHSASCDAESRRKTKNTSMCLNSFISLPWLESEFESSSILYRLNLYNVTFMA